jgi:predicted RNA binding protein YcfA (HicA-like mRNA interferase family)
VPDMRNLSGRDVCEILSHHGFVKIRQRGSHIVMQKKEEGTTTTVPVPDHDVILIGTLMSIIRQSGLVIPFRVHDNLIESIIHGQADKLFTAG